MVNNTLKTKSNHKSRKKDTTDDAVKEKSRKRKHSRSSSSTSSSVSPVRAKKHSKKSKHKKKHRSSSSSSDSEEEREKRRRKKAKKKAKKLMKELKRIQRKKEKQLKNRSEANKTEGSCHDVPLALMDKAKAMVPMTKEEWEKKQSVVRRVYDEETGRHRLIKGDGEVIEEIVSRERHKTINKQSTQGDGNFFQARISSKVKK